MRIGLSAELLERLHRVVMVTRSLEYESSRAVIINQLDELDGDCRQILKSILDMRNRISPRPTAPPPIPIAVASALANAPAA